jgi:hypothetical protein
MSLPSTLDPVGEGEGEDRRRQDENQRGQKNREDPEKRR